MAGGAYIRIKNGNIEIHAPGEIDMKAGGFPHAGPTSLFTQLPEMTKVDGDYTRTVLLQDASGLKLCNQWVEVKRQDGSLVKLLSDDEGMIDVFFNDAIETLSITPIEPLE